eukprot:scaffold7015_cov12-Tisochrysis_lutea.AAC.1
MSRLAFQTRVLGNRLLMADFSRQGCLTMNCCRPTWRKQKKPKAVRTFLWKQSSSPASAST